MKHLIQRIKDLSIHELMFYVFAFSISLQLRTILNSDEAYIGYYFSYHKAIYFYVSDLLFIAFIVSWLFFDSSIKNTPKVLLLPILWPFLLLFHVEHVELGFFAALKWLQFWLIIAYLYGNPKVIWSTLYIIIGTGFFQSLIGIFQFHMQQSIGLRFLGEYVPALNQSGTATIQSEGQLILRAYGTMPHPNVLAGFLAICLGFLAFVSRETLFKHWFIVSCGTVLLLWGLILSFSRSAWIAAILLYILHIGYHFYLKQIKKAIFLAFLVIVSCGTLGFIYKSYVLPRASEAPAESAAANYRAEFNSLGFNNIKENPIFGVGPGQYISKLEDKVSMEPWKYQPPHSIFLLFTAEYGIIGLLLSIFAVIRLCFTWNKIHILSLSLVILVLTLGFFDHYLISIQQGLLLFAIIVGMLSINKIDVSQSVKHL
ncbi:MAG TPA: O-antigen ligase family protein [Candidatus Binatia bacterium]|nr:O-antigen ligase family protein [Candidatus Binatia bacterium]